MDIISFQCWGPGENKKWRLANKYGLGQKSLWSPIGGLEQGKVFFLTGLTGLRG
jgi:hypothetical protein